MGNWTFDKLDDFTLPSGDEKSFGADNTQLSRIHNEFAEQCKYKLQLINQFKVLFHIFNNKLK